MFHLPDEIIRYIYEFDNTYREIFDECLEYICKFKIYKSKVLNIYYIYNREKNVLHRTNNLIKPSFICSSYGVNDEKFKILLKEYNMERQYNAKLEYNIETILFQDSAFIL